jgi:uncharacterized protein (TIGR03643 family)
MVAGTPQTVDRSQTASDIQEPPLASLERYSESLLAGLEAGRRAADAGTGGYVSPWPRMPESLSTLRDLSSQHLLAKEGRLGFVLLRLAKEKQGFSGASAATDELRRLIKLVGGRHTDVTIGLTGLPVMEDDEMRTSQQSMVWASGLSLVAVIIVIIAGFGGVRHAVMANGVLAIGMAWADDVSFEQIKQKLDLSEADTIDLMRTHLKPGSFRAWRKRVSGRKTKHAKLLRPKES